MFIKDQGQTRFDGS